MWVFAAANFDHSLGGLRYQIPSVILDLGMLNISLVPGAKVSSHHFWEFQMTKANGIFWWRQPQWSNDLECFWLHSWIHGRAWKLTSTVSAVKHESLVKSEFCKAQNCEFAGERTHEPSRRGHPNVGGQLYLNSRNAVCSVWNIVWEKNHCKNEL